MTETQTTMLDEALKLAAQGFTIIPLRGKLPRTQNGSKDGTRDESAIRRWWRLWPTADIGICTGIDGLVVIDIDGPEGRASIEKLQEQYGRLPKTLMAKTGGGGWHLLYRTASEIRNVQARGDDWHKVDVRGKGGYIVAPPSVHPETGALYEWVGGPDIAAEELPPRWDDLLTSGTRTRARVTTAATVSELPPIASGERHTELVRLVGKWRGEGKGDEEVWALLQIHNNRCQPPLDEAELAKCMKGTQQWQAPSEEVARSVVSGLADALLNDPLAWADAAMIAAMSSIRDDPAEWAPVAQILRKRSNLREAERAIKQHRAKLARAQLEALADRPVEDAPVQLTIPDRYEVNESGVWQLTAEDQLERLIPVPLYLSRHMRDVDTGAMRAGLVWKRRGQWNDTTCEADVLASSQKIVALANSDLPVDSVNAGGVVKYLRELAAANDIPLVDRVGRTGWIGAHRFFPGAAGDVEYDPQEPTMRHTFDPAGTLEEWVETVKPLRYEYDLLRLQLSASFAGPLLRMTGSRAFLVHLWGRSGGGKTATMLVASSVWGSRRFMRSFYSTKYALTVAASESNDLPLCINEKQLWSGGRYDRLDRMIYELVEGMSKGQGRKDGGTRQALHWLCPILTNGESPIVEDDSEQGVQTRMLEVCGEPITDDAVASALYGQLEKQHGTAGPAFVQALIAMDRKQVVADLELIQEKLSDLSEHARMHIAALSVIALADYYSGVHVFGEEAAEALLYSVAWARQVATKYLGTKAQIDQGETYYRDLCAVVTQHLGVNIARTKKEASNTFQKWGFCDDGYVYLLSSVLKNDIKIGNLGPRALLRELHKRGLVLAKDNGDRTTFSIRLGGSARYNAIKYDPPSVVDERHLVWIEDDS